MKFMVVDDDETAAQVARVTLESMGAAVVVRTTAFGTLAAIMAETPDFLLLDVHMPGVSGDQIAAMVTSGRARIVPKIILFSARSDAAELDGLAQRCGAVGAIVKAGGPSVFKAQLEKILSALNLSLRRPA